MKHRAILATALLAVPVAAGATPAGAAKPTARLIDVHEIHAVKDAAGKPSRGANCSNNGAATGTFETTGWVVSGPKTATLNTTTVPSGVSVATAVSALQASYNAWGGGAPNINVATSTSSVTKPTANHSYNLMWGRTSGSSLAVTYTWQWTSGEIESDTIFGDQFTWRDLGAESDGCYENAGNVYDIANIATHEFGHTYGLDHPAAARFETMYAYGYSGETLKRSPASGDVAGINSLY